MKCTKVTKIHVHKFAMYVNEPQIGYNARVSHMQTIVALQDSCVGMLSPPRWAC